MLSVTGANFTPDNGSVVCADFADADSHLGACPVCALLGTGAELLGRVGSVLAKPHTESLCQCFSPVKNSPTLTNTAIAIFEFSMRSVLPSAQECACGCSGRGDDLGWVQPYMWGQDFPGTHTAPSPAWRILGCHGQVP